MEMFDKIRDWAQARNLINGSDVKSQMLKMTEEVGELAAGIARNKETETLDAIGDCVVVLTILGAQLGVDIEDCINSSYEIIKDRKGKMIDGVFVKDCE